MRFVFAVVPPPPPLSFPFLPAVCDDVRWVGVVFFLCPRRRGQGILTTTDYINLTQCESLEDVRMHLTVRGCLCRGRACAGTGATGAEGACAVCVCLRLFQCWPRGPAVPAVEGHAEGAAQLGRALLAGMVCRHRASLLDTRETHTRGILLVCVFFFWLWRLVDGSVDCGLDARATTTAFGALRLPLFSRVLLSQGTDYGTFLQNEPAPLSTATISEQCTKKLVDEFRFLRTQAVEPLSKFMDYLTYPYMIDNLVLLITGTVHGRDISELIDKCHPLGLFDSMASLCIASTPEELYREIIVDTPLAPYFVECVSLDDLTDVNIEIIRNSLYKAYFADFYAFCNRMGGETAELMSQALAFEADRRAINITLNSFGTELSREERSKLYPSIGLLVPEGTLRLQRADDSTAVGAAIEPYSVYRRLFQSAADNPEKSLEDAFFENEVSLCKEMFEHQFNYAIFYAWLRLKEQEVRNVVWISECISQKQKRRINNFVPIF